eukprot:4423886-Pyramimonas_sp.AAC.1
MQKIVRAFRQRPSAELVLHCEKPVVLVLHALALRQLRHSLHCAVAPRSPKNILSVVLRGTRRVLPRVFQIRRRKRINGCP